MTVTGSEINVVVTATAASLAIAVSKIGIEDTAANVSITGISNVVLTTIIDEAAAVSSAYSSQYVMNSGTAVEAAATVLSIWRPFWKSNQYHPFHKIAQVQAFHLDGDLRS